jgi:prepilin-type N-terminal cleavage/methylation domain-containing protein
MIIAYIAIKLNKIILESIKMLYAKRKTGFTLVELIMVVTIMFVLLAIAIPSYKVFARRARASEAVYQLGAIRTHQISYKVTNGTYLELQKHPPGNVPTEYQPWGNPADENWDKLGFSINIRVRYQYSARPGTSGINTSFVAMAQTDFKPEDPDNDTWELTHDSDLSHTQRYK